MTTAARPATRERAPDAEEGGRGTADGAATAPDTIRRARARSQDVDRHVGRRIRERRVELGVTQQRLAALTGVSYQQVHKYEAGIDRIAVGRLAEIADALGVAPGWLFEGAGGGGGDARPAEGRRRLLELVRVFAGLDRALQEAVLALARSMARDEGEGTGDPDLADAA